MQDEIARLTAALVEQMCRLTRVSHGGFYRGSEEKAPGEAELALRGTIQPVSVAHRRRYGYRRILKELRNQGIEIGKEWLLRMPFVPNRSKNHESPDPAPSSLASAGSPNLCLLDDLASSAAIPNGRGWPSTLGIYVLRGGWARYAPRWTRSWRSLSRSSSPPPCCTLHACAPVNASPGA